MKKIIRLTENDLMKLVKRVIREQAINPPNTPTTMPENLSIPAKIAKGKVPVGKKSVSLGNIRNNIGNNVIDYTNQVNMYAEDSMKGVNFGNDRFFWYTGNGTYAGGSPGEPHLINLNGDMTQSGLSNYRKMYPMV